MDDRKRITLDNPAFAGTLRYQNRGALYARRPVRVATMNDMVAIRRPQAMRPVQPAPVQVAQPVITKLAPKLQQLAPHKAPAVQAVEPPVVQMPKVTIIQPPQLPIQPQSLVRQTLAGQPNGPNIPPTQTGQTMVPESPKGKMQLNKTSVLYAMASIVFVAGVLVSITGLQANKHVAAQVQQSQKTTEATADATHSAPSTVKPSDAVVRSYAVAPNVPRYIDIPKLKVHTRMLSEGVDRTGELQVPWNIYDTGWYNASSQPGQNGAMLVDGHSGIGKTRGVFNQLATLVVDDQIVVTRGDGQKFAYKVVKVQTVDANNVDMNSMLVSANTAKPGLNLITCAGDQIPGTTELNKRVQVYAVLQ